MTAEDSSNRSEKTPFTEINLSETERKKLPKRLVYFSDGVLEEYSTDEEELDGVNPDTQPLIDPKTLPWVPYVGYMIWWLGSRTLAVCDYLGENLAWFLGITSPKFQYELDQYERMAKEEEEFENYIKSENAGWTLNDSESKPNGAIELQPHAKSDSTMHSSDELLEENIIIQQEAKPISDSFSKF